MDSPAVHGGIVSAVEPGTAALAGLRAGDRVIAVDGQPVRDVLDWRWLTEEPSFTITVERDGARVDLGVERRYDEPLGVEFSEALFTPVRQCDNACAFCFISGLPPGLRPALYVRDDDFRLSFMSGNFITLTNMADQDVERVLTQRLSPLHVSVHAVDPAVRARLICPTAEDTALEILDTLLHAGIGVHVQIVLVPGVNDGAVLAETLAYLSSREGVLSVGCVPMGYTRHQRRWTTSYEPHTAAALLESVTERQTIMRGLRGAGWVYAADEFYLIAGASVPPAEAYDDFPQFENGIGMTSAFLAELAPAPEGMSPAATVVTGELFAPVVRRALQQGGWTGVRVLPVPNELFGGNVSVTGLLCGQDIARAIAADAHGGRYLVPDVVVNSDGLLLDDTPALDLPQLAGADVRIIGSDAASLVAALEAS